MSNFTPGPWTLRDDVTFSSLGDRRVIGADCISPCIVFGGIEESEPNARLIAAAPDLLSALKGLLAHVESWRVVETAGGDIARSIAAIAKAEGR